MPSKRPANHLPREQRAASLAELDQKILKLINQRARLTRTQTTSANPGSNASGTAVIQSTDFDDLLQANPGPLHDRCVRSIFRELTSGCCALVTATTVAYLGPPYSYSHLAALERFGSSAELVPVSSIAAVFAELAHQHTDFGIVPIENTTDGRVVDTLDMFARMPTNICGEVQLAIHHNLLGSGKRQDVREVCSKPQAISQCRGWLAKHLPAAKIVETASTAVAAKRAAKKPSVAAIASREAGVQYGLKVIVGNIEDNPNNVTRFAVIGPNPGKRSGNDKTALMFEIAHCPGALADAMAVFKRRELNMTWIESFPMPDSKNEYLFFVEVEGHFEDEYLKRALLSLEKKTTRLEVLGAYRKQKPVG